jgi:hypothetical protein
MPMPNEKPREAALKVHAAVAWTLALRGATLGALRHAQVAQ